MKKLRPSKLPDDPAKLKDIILNMEQQYRILEAKAEAVFMRCFVRGSEKLPKNEAEQGWLFNEAELGVAEAEKENKEAEVNEVKAHTRKKGGKRPLPAELPREKVVHDVDEKEKSCTCCGKERPEMPPVVHEELDIIPPQIKVIQHVKKQYGECKCDDFGGSEQPGVITADEPERLLPGSTVGPGLLAYITVSKFADAMTYYRMEKGFARIGAGFITRQTISNWMLSASAVVSELVELMWEKMREGPVIGMDETKLQVLHEPGRAAGTDSFMWVSTGYHMVDGEARLLITFNYSPSRSSKVPNTLLAGYSGILQTDGYAAYGCIDNIDAIIQVGCFAHVRRKFFDSGKKGAPLEALGYIKKLYGIEKELRKLDLNDEEFVAQRKKKVEPILKKFHKWLKAKELTTAAGTNLGDAVRYALGQWSKLICYLDHHLLTPDNNGVERVIKHFAVGRKNWMFAINPRGAHASATLYSLVQSAIANELEPYRYLRYIFTHFHEMKRKGDLINLLPSNLTPEDIEISTK